MIREDQREKAAIIIQKAWKKYKQNKERRQKAALIIQSSFRKFLHQKSMKQLIFGQSIQIVIKIHIILFQLYFFLSLVDARV